MVDSQTAWLQVLCIQGGMALLGRAEVEVCCYVADVNEYTPLACTVHSDAITGDLLIFVVCHCCCCCCCCCKMILWFKKSTSGFHLPVMQMSKCTRITVRDNQVGAMQLLQCPLCCMILVLGILKQQAWRFAAHLSTLLQYVIPLSKIIALQLCEGHTCLPHVRPHAGVTVYDCPLAQQHADVSCAMQATPVTEGKPIAACWPLVPLSPQNF